jgi:hypothetical protein
MIWFMGYSAAYTYKHIDLPDPNHRPASQHLCSVKTGPISDHKYFTDGGGKQPLLVFLTPRTFAEI